MTLIEAAKTFYLAADRSWWPEQLPPARREDDVWHHHEYINWLVAAVTLTGRLSECSTEIELRAAVEETANLEMLGLIDIEQWAEEAVCVGEEMMWEWRMFHRSLGG